MILLFKKKKLKNIPPRTATNFANKRQIFSNFKCFVFPTQTKIESLNFNPHLMHESNKFIGGGD